MATERIVFDDSYVATATLATKQFYAVKLGTAANACIICSDGAKPLGILQNKPTAGQTARVMVEGRSLAVFGATCAIGKSWSVDTNGRLQALVASDWCGGVVMDTATLGATPSGVELAAVHVGCLNPWKADSGFSE